MASQPAYGTATDAGVWPIVGGTLDPVPDGSLSHPCLASWRRHTASGAVLTAVALGLRHAVDERADGEARVADAPRPAPDPDTPIDLHFDPRGPDDTWVVVRPWLLGREPLCGS